MNDQRAVVHTKANGKGDRCRAPKDFDGDENKYKTWFRLLEAYMEAYPHLYLNDNAGIKFTLSYMTSGRAADWAEHFTDTHMKEDENRKRYFDTGINWAEFVLLLNKTFDVRRTQDKAKTDLAVLKHKPGNLKQYILDFNAMANQAGYILPNDMENPVLPVLFLPGLIPAL